jgi:tRNA uridine 5-carboxymethylaminomethyl modification enzyme
MFTSRAEYRLTLRADNADQRLTPLGLGIGCVGGERSRRFAAKTQELAAGRALLAALRAYPEELNRAGIEVGRDGVRRSAEELLAYPEVTVARLAGLWPALSTVAAPIAEQLEIDARYSGYLRRQTSDIEAFRRDEALALPPDLDVDRIGGLSTEVRSKLKSARPATLGAAARISGVTPAALVALLRHVKRRGDRLRA